MWQISNTLLFLECHVLTKIAGYYCQKKETRLLFLLQHLPLGCSKTGYQKKSMFTSNIAFLIIMRDNKDLLKF